MIKVDIDKFRTQYIDSAIQHGAASIDGDYKTANKEYKKIEKIFNKISETPECKDFFYSLFQHGDSNVKVWAGCHALSLNILIDELLDILHTIAQEEPGVANLNAKMVLKQWRKGNKLGGECW